MYQNPTKRQRNVIQNKLETLPCVKHVYFQPPASVKMEYPCVLVELSGYETLSADNNPYLSWPRYNLEFISRNLESDIPRQIQNLRGDFIARFERFFTFDNLNHWVFSLVVTKAIEDND